MRKPSLWLSICGIWILLLGLGPFLRSIFVFLVHPSVSQALIQEIGVKSFVWVVMSVPHYTGFLQKLAHWLVQPLPLSDSQRLLEFTKSISGLLDIVITCGLIRVLENPTL